MTDTIRLQIREAFVTALAAAAVGTDTKPTGLTVHTLRPRPIQHDNLPAMVVYLLDEPSPEPRAAELVDRTIPIGVECRIEVPSGTGQDEAMDPYTNWAVLAVMADETLGGLAYRIDEGATERPSPEGGEVHLNRVGVAFNVHYHTRRNDPGLRT